MTKLIHEDLSYAVRGVLFNVHTALGPKLPEQFYQDAVMIGLEEQGIACQAEKGFSVYYEGVNVGNYYVDVWIEDGKMLLELKVDSELRPLHQAQAISYLKITNADLALLVNFGQSSLQDKRLLNLVRDKQVPFEWQPMPTAPDMLYPELTNHLQEMLHRVHFTLGPGFIHQVYRRAMMVELREYNIGYEYIKQIPIYYKGHHLGNQETYLLYVEEKILLAPIAVRQLTSSLKVQLKSRLKHHGAKLGIIANFNQTKLDIAFVR
jgi:GxxExxY protein